MIEIIFNNGYGTPVHYQETIGQRSHKSCFSYRHFFHWLSNGGPAIPVYIVDKKIGLCHNRKKCTPRSAILTVIACSIKQNISTIIPGRECRATAEVAKV